MINLPQPIQDLKRLSVTLNPVRTKFFSIALINHRRDIKSLVTQKLCLSGHANSFNTVVVRPFSFYFNVRLKNLKVKSHPYRVQRFVLPDTISARAPVFASLHGFPGNNLNAVRKCLSSFAHRGLARKKLCDKILSNSISQMPCSIFSSA